MLKRGGQEGNDNAVVGKKGRQALELALHHYHKGYRSWKGIDELEVVKSIKTMVLMWMPIIEKGIDEGDLAAMKEINDRLDGKPAQSVSVDAEISGPGGKPIEQKWIIEVIDKTGE